MQQNIFCYPIQKSKFPIAVCTTAFYLDIVVTADDISEQIMNTMAEQAWS